MRKIVFSPEARIDLQAINAYIAQDNPGAANKLLERIEKRCHLLAVMPRVGKLFAPKPPIRMSSVGDHVIFYRVEIDLLRIIRVLHGKRDRSKQ